MTTFEFANQTGSDANYALDLIIDGRVGTRVSSTVTDGIHTINLKRDGKKIASYRSSKGRMLSQDEVREWAKANA